MTDISDAVFQIRFRRALAETLGERHRNAPLDAVISEMASDSFETLDLLATLELEFDIEFPDDMVPTTVGQMVEAVKGLVTEPARKRVSGL